MWALLMLTLCSYLEEGMRPSYCQIVCSENEIFVNNVSPCNTCENRNVCSLSTDERPGCDCLPGYYKNDGGKCVLEEDCEGQPPSIENRAPRRSKPANKIICRNDEVFLECSCERTCCNGGKKKGCSASCSKGCFCKKGRVRHEDGRCIRLQDCEKQNSPSSDSTPKQCSMPKCDAGCSIDYSTRPCPSCSCANTATIQCSMPKCGPGCSIDHSTEPCPSCSCTAISSSTKCRPDEELYECIPICHRTCSAYLTKSYLFCKMPCNSGCFCREGLYKTNDGRCVPASQCTAPNSPPESSCGENAEYQTCGSACPATCANRGKLFMCSKQCVSGCFCKKGFMKNDQGICVQPKDCRQSPPKIQCLPPKCGPGCSINHSTMPCPSCSCPDSPTIQCFPPKCNAGCSIDYSTKPCPSCSCSDMCGENEEFRKCGSDCPTTCANLGKNIMCTMQCVPGCFCAKGLVRNDQGKCVPPDECPQNSVVPTEKPTEICDEDEEYQMCGSACPSTCDNLGKNLPCILQCVSGCFCRKGMVRNDDGKCVEPEKCPQSPPPVQCSIPLCPIGCNISYSTKSCPSCSCTGNCSENEEYSACASPCNTCSTRGKCDTPCSPGCDCKKGYYRDFQGKCIPKKQCPRIEPRRPRNRCGRDQQFYECIPRCSRTCEAYTREPKAFCSELCVSGCFCKEGLYERDYGECVPPTQCPAAPPKKQCPQNEEHSDCVIPCNDCQIRGKCNFLVCNKGCDCKKGYYRNTNGRCILESRCPIIERPKPTPPKCGKDEQYYNCVPSCQNTCDTYKRKMPCPLICVPGCYCKEGMIKNREGKCVKPSECASTNPPPTATPLPTNPICLQPKEVGTCLAIIPRFFYKLQTGQCEPFSYGGCGGNKNNFKTKKACERACRNSPTPSQPKCGKDEEYYGCVPNCHNTCDTYNQKGACPFYCLSGCFCKKGMVKNKDGKCVEPSQCPSTNTTPSENSKECGTNEEYYDECAPSCTGTCRAYNNPGIYHCPKCRPGCWCIQGFVKTSDGQCVPPDQCDIPTTNTTTPTPTSIPICQQPRVVGPCRALMPRYFYNQETHQCEKFNYGGCRGNKNNFETKEECEATCGSAMIAPTCGPDEQYYSCVPNCHNTCATYNKTNIGCPDSCGPGCFCKEGLIKNDDGACVTPSQCNALQPTDCSEECGENEEYYDDCAPKCTGTCEAYNNPGIYNCPLCRPGCWCSQGLVKKSDGQCVPPDQCNVQSSTGPPDQCGENEEYYKDCAPSCGGTCETHDKRPILNCRLCRPGCWCRKGFVKRKDGKCVRKDQCDIPIDKCREDEEYLDCGSACPPSCSTLGKSSFACIALCVPGCFCKQGLIRNDQGECVESKDCPQNTCGEDEEYRECGSACPPTCSNLGRNQICTQQCVKGCFCEEGLVRNDEGKCVEPEDCPEPTCNADEEYKECGSSCPPTCSNYDRDRICHKDCIPGCFCSGVLVRNDEGKCVEPDDCPSGGTTPTVPPNKCGAHEEYKECGSACPSTCANLGMECTLECEPGCFCKKGFVRNDKGQCVEPGDCPQKSPEECGEDEKYYDCAPSCGGTCDTYNMTAVILCLPCGPGCWCNEGLVKNSEGRCVPPEQCEVPKEPNKLCGVNEIYYDKCAPSCRGSCDTYDQIIECPECTPGCWCKKGYLKNRHGKCVPKRKCNIKSKIPTCPTDQQFYDCIPSCKRTCMTYNSTSVYCPKTCIEGCFCKDGLVMNKNGTCVPPKECSLICPWNQKYYECMPDCKNRCNRPEACAAVCKCGCFCKEGLVMREDGMCVRKELCKAKNNGKPQCGPDQEYYDCFQRCRNSCGTRNGVCPTVCETGCFCRKGLLLNSHGKCVKADECDKCSGENEEIVQCAKPKWCNTCGIRGNCKLKRCDSGCDCKSGYYRDDSGTCIPQDKCPRNTSTENTNQESGNTSVTFSENDSHIESSYSEESFSSTSETQSSESGSMGQSSIIRKRSSGFDSDSGSWFFESESGNEIDFEKNSSEELVTGYSSESSTATESSSNMSSDSENSSSSSLSGSKMWSSSSSSSESAENEIDIFDESTVSEDNSSSDSESGYSTSESVENEVDIFNELTVSEDNSSSDSVSGYSTSESAENEIDSFDESTVSEDNSSSDSKSGYSTMTSGSESWSADMSDDSEKSSSKSLSGSRMWSSSTSNSKKSSSGDETDYSNTSSVSDDNLSEGGTEFSRSSTGAADWSSMMAADSENSSSKSLSGSRMWSSKMSSDFENGEEQEDEEEDFYEKDEAIYEDNENEFEEYSYSWTEVEDNDGN